MKKLLLATTIIFLSLHGKSQSLSTDSLSIIIRGMQKQIVTLQAQVSNLSKPHSITFDPANFTVQNIDSLNQKVILKGAPVDLTAVNQQIATAIQNKIAALKATSITTTTIQ